MGLGINIMLNKSIWLTASLFIVAIICLAGSEIVLDYYYSRSHNPLERAFLHQERGVLIELFVPNSGERIFDKEILRGIEENSSNIRSDTDYEKSLEAVLVNASGNKYNCTISFSLQNNKCIGILVHSEYSDDTWREYTVLPKNPDEKWWITFRSILQKEAGRNI